MWLIRALALAFMGLSVLPARAQSVTGAAGTVTVVDPLPFQAPRIRPAANERVIDDMILDVSRMQPLGESAARGANIELFSARPWEFGIVPVAFDANVTGEERTAFFAACQLWQGAGVLCLPRTDHSTWVQVRKEPDGCFAKVGMGAAGAQPINLQSPGCWGAGTIAHEIGHALGLIHEHQRPDRDTYVTIVTDNVDPQYLSNFTRVASARLWTPYDFSSVMHYPRTSFPKSPGLETITPKSEYLASAQTMGQRTGPSEFDRTALSTIYNLPPRVFRSYTPVPRRLGLGRAEALSTMAAINAYYVASHGLDRPNGLSLNGRPDFLGLAAWFFDVYVNTRWAGYEEVEARFNVMANITRTDEWRVKHPGLPSGAAFTIGNALPFDRSELLAVLERLDRFYSSPEGLQRAAGLSLDGQPDFLGIAAWVVDVYMSDRLNGLAADAAWQHVVDDIRATDEWKSKHR
ncbi:MAG: M12 family metallopeptidase [Vicinamibacterales bacterium]